MLDFTSALYLGLGHSSASLPGWRQFTLGKPAALESPPGVDGVARRLAHLQACESAMLGPSTLHLFLDVFGLLAEQEIIVFMDSSVYPIARCGVERAAGRGVPVRLFPHHSGGALRADVARTCGRRRRPVIITDGVCPQCNCVAPLDEYQDVARDKRGWVVVDDTQALGVLGEGPCEALPYGQGGGGTARWLATEGPELVLVCSLAKGFGVPIAALAGNQGFVGGFVRRSSTRIHCSPPSIPAIAAAARALEINRVFGEALRHRLLANVRRLRWALHGLGLRTNQGLFPVQSFHAPPGLDPVTLHAGLLRRGIATVLQRAPGEPRTRITVLLTANHTPADVDLLVAALAESVGARRWRSSTAEIKGVQMGTEIGIGTSRNTRFGGQRRQATVNNSYDD